MELVNDLKGYQLIFPLPLHVVGTFFLRVKEGSLWNTSRLKFDKTTQQRILSNHTTQASQVHKRTTRQDSSAEIFVMSHQRR